MTCSCMLILWRDPFDGRHRQHMPFYVVLRRLVFMDFVHCFSASPPIPFRSGRRTEAFCLNIVFSYFVVHRQQNGDLSVDQYVPNSSYRYIFFFHLPCISIWGRNAFFFFVSRSILSFCMCEPRLIVTRSDCVLLLFLCSADSTIQREQNSQQ